MAENILSVCSLKKWNFFAQKRVTFILENMYFTINFNLFISMGTIKIIGRLSINIFDFERAKQWTSKSQRAPSMNIPLM